MRRELHVRRATLTREGVVPAASTTETPATAPDEGQRGSFVKSVGGVLGIGDKLFAIPFRELKFTHGKEEMYFVLDISKEKLDQAPGFDKSQWPDFADPQWRDKIDRYYQKSTTERTTRTDTQTEIRKQ